MPESDLERFTELYEAHHARVLTYARSRVPAEYADDVVAERRGPTSGRRTACHDHRKVGP